MRAFSPHVLTLQGHVVLAGEVDDVFPLFSPVGEKLWVPGWEPELLWPAGTDWAEGQIFRTREETGDAVWIVTRIDRAGHTVEYHRVEAGRYVARVEVRCRPTRDHGAQADVSYSYVGLSEEGNRDIAAMSQKAYDEKMARWTTWIEKHLASRGGRPPETPGAGSPPDLEPAQPSDLAAIEDLLAANDLPVEGVAERLVEFLIARSEGAVAGTVGLETYGHVALLRSLCVAETHRGRGLGRRLCAAVEALADARGVRELYLLTTTAERFFAGLGFETVRRESVPSALQGAAEFRSLCPASAICMRKARHSAAR